MTQNIVVRLAEDLIVAWAQRVVDRHVADITVSAIDVRSVDLGTTTRVRVGVKHDGPEAFPRRWFVKLPAKSWRTWSITALSRLLWTEVCFYNDVANVIPVTIPTVLAAQSRIGRGATLVLADVNELGAIPGSPGDRLTVTQAAAVIE